MANSEDMELNKNAKKKKKVTKRQKQTRKLVLIGVEVLCLVVVVGALYAWKLFSRVDIDTGFTDSEAGVNEDLSEDTIVTLEGYTNIALFGLDNRKVGESKGGHSDVIMIASIDNKTKEVKLVSVYRDTYLSVGNGKYTKANNAYFTGGAKQAVQMLNSNLDLDIKEYVCVDWAAVIQTVDALGGVEIDITSAEVKYLNKYVRDMHKEIGSDNTQIKGPGKQTLNGAQATAYARIRYTSGNDFKRASRQRIVLEAMLNKAKSANISTLLDICNVVFGNISTSLELTEILDLAKDVTKYSIGSTTGFPFEVTTKILSGGGDTVIPIGLEDDVAKLHKYMFGTENYVPSMTVQAISNSIEEKTGVKQGDTSINVDKFNDTAGQDGTSFKDDEKNTEEN